MADVCTDKLQTKLKLLNRNFYDQSKQSRSRHRHNVSLWLKARSAFSHQHFFRHGIMAFYNRSDLVFSDYRWSLYTSDDPRVIGTPDGTPFNPLEGYEMLYLVNRIMQQLGLITTVSGHLIERMIRGDLPPDMECSQELVSRWVINHWSR